MVLTHTTFADRLHEQLTKLGWPARGRPARLRKEMAGRGYSLSEKACQKWFNGDSLPDTKKLNDIAAIASTSVEHLLSGRADIKQIQAFMPTYSANAIPRISWEDVVLWLRNSDLNEVAVDKWFNIDGQFSEKAYALNVVGDSMTSPSSPSIPDGCVIVVEPKESPRHGSLVVAQLPDTKEPTFKRLVVDGSKRYLEPLNPRYKLIEIDETCEVYGVVKRAVMHL